MAPANHNSHPDDKRSGGLTQHQNRQIQSATSSVYTEGKQFIIESPTLLLRYV